MVMNMTRNSFAAKWRHPMKTFSALLALCERNPRSHPPVTGELSSQGPVTRSFDVFFDPYLDERLCKQSRRWWFETPSRPLWRHCNGMIVITPCVRRIGELNPSNMLPTYSLASRCFHLKLLSISTSQWRHNEHDGVSNHQPHDCLLKRLFKHRSKNSSKLRVTGLLWGEFTSDRWIPRTNGQ